jgi:hypothetical protein
VTTGTYIEESRIDFLNKISNFGLDLSLITMQDQREALMTKSTRCRINAILHNATLNKISLMFTGNIDALKRDLDFLLSLALHRNATQILVRRIEYTSFSHPSLLSVAAASIDGYVKCIQMLNESYPGITFTVPSLQNEYRGGNNEYFLQAEKRIRALLNKIKLEPNKQFDLICPESSYEFFLRNFSNCQNARVNLVKNKLYGGSVTVAGLLNHSDVVNQYRPRDNTDIMVLPYEMYDSHNCDILGSHISALAHFFKVEIWLA